ncbi:hypothetical protein V5O48_018715, partial [Marasmius crinis-equi]
MSADRDDAYSPMSAFSASRATDTSIRGNQDTGLPEPGAFENTSSAGLDESHGENHPASRISFFRNNYRPTIAGGQFNAARVIHIHNHSSGATGTAGSSRTIMADRRGLPSWKPPRGIKEIDIGDIVMNTEVSSRTAYVQVNSQPGARGAHLIQKTWEKVAKKVQRAEIPQLGVGLCTVMQFEALNPNGTKALEMGIQSHVADICSRHRSPHTLQLLGIGVSDVPTLIYHDLVLPHVAWVNGEDLLDHWKARPRVYAALDYMI